MKKNKVAMVVYSYYPADPRVRREAEALVKAGISVEVICLKDENESKIEYYNEVKIRRINIRRSREGFSSYIINYFLFSMASFFLLTFLNIKNRFDIIHIHNMPDGLVFAGLIPKIFGSKIILDLHDPMPEVFIAKYQIGYKHWMIKLLIIQEKICIRFSDLVLTPNIAFKKIFVERGCPKNKISIIMNSPQEYIFDKNRMIHTDQSENNKKFVIMYHGTIVERHGLDLALEALSKLDEKIPNLEFNVYGDGDHFVEQFKSLVSELSLDHIVKYHGKVSAETIADSIGAIDIGIIPNKRTEFTEINLPTRIFEYLSFEKAVIVPKTQGICDYFDDQSIFFFETGNASSLAETISKLHNNEYDIDLTIKNGVKIYEEHKWSREEAKFTGIIHELLT